MSRILGRDSVVRPPGVIDTLSAGYDAINRRLWLLIFPIGLDLLFWLGPKVSIARVAGLLPLSAMGTDEASVVSEFLANFNLAFVLALYIPTVLGWAPTPFAPPPLGEAMSRPVYQILPDLFLPGMALALVSGLLLTACYLGGMGQIVLSAVQRSGRAPNGPAAPLARPAPVQPETDHLRGKSFFALGLRTWRRILVWHLLLLAGGVGLIIVAVVAVSAARAISAEVGGFVLLLLQLALTWIVFYFFFALDAVVLTDLAPLRAALSSVRLIQTHFWPSIGLIGLSMVITTGLPIVWRAMSAQPVGLMASIVGNAYIGSGLMAAGMLFYRDRTRSQRGQTIGDK